MRITTTKEVGMTLAQIPEDVHLPVEANVAKGYEWFSQSNLNRALQWATAVKSTSDIESTRYLISAIIDLVHFDRASRAVSVLPDDKQPIREADLEATIYKGGPHWMRGTGRYHLRRKPFVWGPDAPPTAVDAL